MLGNSLNCLIRRILHPGFPLVHSNFSLGKILMKNTLTKNQLQVSCVYHSTTRAIFQWTNLCCLGGTRTLQPSPDLHSQHSTSWTTRLPFVWRLLQVLLTQPLWTTMDCHCGFQNSRHKSLYSTKSLQDLSYPGYVLDNDDSFRVVSCLYKLFGSWLQIGRIQIWTGTTTPLTNLFL